MSFKHTAVEDCALQVCCDDGSFKDASFSLHWMLKILILLVPISILFLKNLGICTYTFPPRLFSSSLGETHGTESVARGGGWTHADNFQVPFFYHPTSQAIHAQDGRGGDVIFSELMKILEDYKNNMNTVIAALVQSWELAQTQEWILFHPTDNTQGDKKGVDSSRTKLYSMQLEERINATATVLELDSFVLEKLLQPIEFVRALPSSDCVTQTDLRSTSLFTQWKENSHSSSKEDEKEGSSYDSAMQITAHITRDWTVLGRPIRKSLYDWCIAELQSSLKSERLSSSVLVPGAGLGRMAYDIASNGYNVEANEISLVMSAAAFQLLQNQASGVVHPFAFDFLVNEADSSMKYQQVSFPDLERREWDPNKNTFGSLSYTVGDFVETYSTLERRRQFGAVVTCFFIDTATNIYEYLLVIRNCLRFGGSWINVGPLQWHSNAKLHPSGDELRFIIESLGFKITSWQVDEIPLNYRDDDRTGKPRYTKYEGYKPLRFVATLPSQGWDEGNTIEQIIKMRLQSNPRKGPIDEYTVIKNDEEQRESYDLPLEIEEIQ
jgi:carnosine N-methyltransferase